MRDIRNGNLRNLKNKLQALPTCREKMVPDTSLQLVTAKSGDVTLKKNSGNQCHHFIHSNRDPRQEARLWVDNQRLIMPDLVIMGIGLGYHIFELLKRCEKIENAYLIEADERMFQLAETVHGFSGLADNAAIHFLIGQPLSNIAAKLTQSLVHPFSCHIFSPIVSLYPGKYHPVRKWVEKHLCSLRLSKRGDTPPARTDRLTFARGIESVLYQMST